MNKQADLIKYLPPILREYKDYQAITSTENPEFKLIFETSNKTRNNMFIKYCDIDGVKRYEKLLRIIPSANDTLEDRKLRVLSRWDIEIPYTWRVLIQKLNVICGAGNYTIELINDKYIIRLDTNMNTQSQYDELLFLLEKIIPVNMVVESSNTLRDNLTGNMFIGIAMLDTKLYTITNDIVYRQEIEYGYRYGTGISQYSADVIE